MLTCICRAGRNQAYLDLAIKFAIDVIKDALLLGVVPDAMRPYVPSVSALCA